MAEEAAPLDFKDRESLEAWLKSQPREVAVIIAARAALRALPLFSRSAPHAENARQFAEWTLALFRATAVARVAGKYPARAYELRDTCHSARFAVVNTLAGTLAGSIAATFVAEAVQKLALAAAYALVNMPAHAFRFDYSVAPEYAVAEAASEAVHAAVDAAAAAAAFAAWTLISEDARAIRWSGGAPALANLPLWTDGALPTRITESWMSFERALPTDEDWDVWIDWYEARLSGGPVPEEIEFVYATVPQEKWDEGPAAANEWIKDQLRRLRDVDLSDNLVAEDYVEAEIVRADHYPKTSSATGGRRAARSGAASGRDRARHPRRQDRLAARADLGGLFCRLAERGARSPARASR